MKKRNRGLMIFAIIALIAAGILAAGLIYAEQYQGKFIKGTYINGIDVSEKTDAEVEKMIRNRVENYALTVHFPDGRTEVLDGSSFGYAYTSDSGVSRLLARQNRYEWLAGMLGVSTSYTVNESYTYDPEKLREAMLALPEFSDSEVIAPQDAYLLLGADNRLIMVPEVEGNTLRPEIVLGALRTAVETGKSSVDLSSLPDASVKVTRRSDDPVLGAQLEDLNKWLDISVTWDLYDGSQVVLDRSRTASWLQPDGNGGYVLKEETIRAESEAFLGEMAKKYDKVSKEATFNSTNHGQMTIQTERTGYLVDESEETEELVKILSGRESVEREPIYALNVPIVTSVSGTYVEVDIDAQMVYFYRDGERIFESACVTGKATDPSRATPRGLFSIIEKDTSRVLRGEPDASGNPSYESFVNYWMRVYEGVGLHDASWRSSFGGDIYVYSGSHGCINMPYSAAQTLYGLVEYGTTVVIV